MVDEIYQKRIFFPKGKQADFLFGQIKNLNMSWSDLADKIGVHKRTLNDWKREKYSMPIDVLKKICKFSNSGLPKNIRIKSAFGILIKVLNWEQ